MTVLVVEGNSHVRDAIAAILEADGYEVLIASNANEARHLMSRRSDIVLVLADITVPFLDPSSLCQANRASSDLVAVPLVMVTGAIPPESLPPGVPLLKKPFGMNELLQTVRTQGRMG